MIKGMSDEAHFSAEQSGSGTSSRFSASVVNSSGSQHSARTSGTRSEEAERVTTSAFADVSKQASSAFADLSSKMTAVQKRRDFLAANSAKRAATAGFVLQMRPRGDDTDAKRVGFTVTKKIGNAVARNRMKRRLRALAREVIGQRGVAGADHILIGRSSGIERDFAKLRADLIYALNKVQK